jgi:hypothetical protein
MKMDNFLDQSDGYYCLVEQPYCTLRIYYEEKEKKKIE